MFIALAQMMHFATITLFLLLMRNDQLQTATKTTKQLSELKKHMQQLSDLLTSIDSAIGGSQWFVFFLLGTGLFFTLYLAFPQFRYFKYALKIVRGKFDREGDEGDTSHFQALTTALSGTVGTGNIAGVAFALHLGGGTGSTFLGAGNGGNWYDHQICGGNPLAQEVKTEVKSFWNEYAERFPEEKPPRY